MTSLSAPGCVVLSYGDGFGLPGAVAAGSAAAHVPDGVEVVVATTGLGARASELLVAAVEAQGVAVTVVDSTPWVDGLPTVSRYVRDTWTRAFAAAWLPDRFERAVYLDADTLTIAPLDRLFGIELTAPLSALVDPAFPTFEARGAGYADASGLPPTSPYFNTGVLVFDRSAWDGVAGRVSEVIAAGRLPIDYVDQDVLNVVMHGRWEPLDHRWHRLVGPGDDLPDGAVVHFTGPLKPWDLSGRAGSAARAYRQAAAAIGWTW